VLAALKKKSSRVRHLPDEDGAKALIQENLSRVAQVDFANGVFDLDTPEDLLIWQEREEAF
jgi:CTP:molybdopterin cytidylyltransferase MocA